MERQPPVLSLFESPGTPRSHPLAGTFVIFSRENIRTLADNTAGVIPAAGQSCQLAGLRYIERTKKSQVPQIGSKEDSANFPDAIKVVLVVGLLP